MIVLTEIELCEWIKEIHSRFADGCKSSCDEQEVGFHHSSYHDDSYWFCRFGGYCLGSLSRHENIQAPTLEELVIKVKEIILEAVEEIDD